MLIHNTGIVNQDGSINNTESIKRLAEVSLAYAKAGLSVMPQFGRALVWGLFVLLLLSPQDIM